MISSDIRDMENTNDFRHVLRDLTFHSIDGVGFKP